MIIIATKTSGVLGLLWLKETTKEMEEIVDQRLVMSSLALLKYRLATRLLPRHKTTLKLLFLHIIFLYKNAGYSPAHRIRDHRPGAHSLDRDNFGRSKTRTGTAVASERRLSLPQEGYHYRGRAGREFRQQVPQIRRLRPAGRTGGCDRSDGGHSYLSNPRDAERRGVRGNGDVDLGPGIGR